MDFPIGTTGVLVNGKAIPLHEYLIMQGGELEYPAPKKAEVTVSLSTAPAGEVAEKTGASHLLENLHDAGFYTAADIANASIDDLTAVSGIGKATAVKLKAAAEELLS